MSSDIKCPICGSDTDLRTRKRDGVQFHVCKRHPKCMGMIEAIDWENDWDEEKEKEIAKDLARKYVIENYHKPGSVREIASGDKAYEWKVGLMAVSHGAWTAEFTQSEKDLFYIRVLVNIRTKKIIDLTEEDDDYPCCDDDDDGPYFSPPREYF